MTNNKKNKKSKGGGKTIAKIVGWLVLEIAIIAASVFTTGYAITGTANPVKWGQSTVQPDKPNNPDNSADTNNPNKPGNPDNPDTPDTPVIEDGEAGLLVSPVEEVNAKMRIAAVRSAEVNTYSENNYTLTATISPAEATNKKVSWSIAWQNAASTWASGKTVTDYVEVIPTAEGSLTANLICKQAFGEKIVITAESEDNPEIKATCVCNYRKRLKGIAFNIRNSSNSYSCTFDKEKKQSGTMRILKDTETYSFIKARPLGTDGTVGGEINSVSLTFCATERLKEIMDAKGSINGNTPIVKTEDKMFGTLRINENVSFDFKQYFFDYVVYVDLDFYEDDYDDTCNQIINEINKYKDEALMCAIFEVDYGGINCRLTFDVYLDVSDATYVPVSGMGFNNTEIEF